MFYPSCRVRLGGVTPLPAVRACAGEVGVPIVRNRVSLPLRPPALRRMSPACGSAGPVTAALRCHRDGRCREGVFPTAPRKREALKVPNIVHTALARLYLYPVSKGQRSRAGALSSLPLCRGCCDSQSPSQAGAALAWGMLLLAFPCFSFGV